MLYTGRKTVCSYHNDTDVDFIAVSQVLTEHTLTLYGSWVLLQSYAQRPQQGSLLLVQLLS